MPTSDIIALTIVGVLILFALWVLWRRCPAKSIHGDICDLKRGHDGMHYVDHAFVTYHFRGEDIDDVTTP